MQAQPSNRDPHPSPVVHTTVGDVRGLYQGGVFRFRGIPYGQDTGGARRFLAARPAQWTGVRDAFTPGPRSPQNEPATSAPWHTWLRDPSPAAEDCLVLNVSSTDLQARQPVMVYLHGGAFAMSSGGTPGVDGANLARLGVVVVTLNHRLNLFGHLWLGTEEPFADAGNAGLLDIVLALQWVRVNIARFGGDPSQVTLFGQSGGGSKVAALMTLPAAQGLFHRAIIQSASSLLRMATLEEAERNTQHLLRVLALDWARRQQLQQLPAQTLLDAMPAAIHAAGVDDYRPVVDGRVLPHQPFDPAAHSWSSGMPLMAGWCENEQRLAFAGTPSIYALDAQAALARTADALGIGSEHAAQLTQVYGAGRPGDSPGDLHAQLVGDFRYRHSLTPALERHAAGGAPTWAYLLRWKSPVADGLLRTPHTLCLAFAFANVDIARGITGEDEDRYRLQDEMAGAWVAFARTGRPQHASLPDWQPYDTATRPTLVFDRASRLVHDPLADERIALATCPPYRAAIEEGRLNAARWLARQRG